MGKSVDIINNIAEEYLTPKEILKLWEGTHAPTGVYIHSPFCKEQCDYCTYKGTLFNKNDFNRFYSEYLPSLIGEFHEILASDKIDTYFFGGGTPSLMSVEVMKSLFDIIPNFKSNPKKLMEIHMCDWTEEKLDTLKKYNFSTVIACVQTFDNTVLKAQKRRTPRDPLAIKRFVEYSLSLGLNGMSDVIYFDTGNKTEDYNRLLKDITTLMDYSITEITIHTIFNTSLKFIPEADRAIEEALEYNSLYRLDNSFETLYEGMPRRKAARLYIKGSNPSEVFPQYHYMEGLDTRSPYLHQSQYNVLGLGSYKNFNHTVSRIEDKIEYIELGDTVTPKWKVTFDINKAPLSALVFETLKNIEDNIGPIPDGVYFYFESSTVSYNANTRDKVTNRGLDFGFKYDVGTTNILSFIAKLETQYPSIQLY